MLVRPNEQPDQMTALQQSVTIRLPIDAARMKAREILNQSPLGGFVPVVENWRQLPDGHIEFTTRHLPTPN